MYTDTNRVPMEYLDNSFDSAESLYDKTTNSYSRPIEIKVEIIGSTYKDAIVKIKDNCLGIDDINRVTNSLGNSKKTADEYANGQFGFGMYSFLAICNNITIATKVSESNIDRTIALNSKMFDKASVDEVEIGMILERIRLRNDGSSYTNIVLSGFDKDKFREFSSDSLKTEIEKHFEILLRRGNISVVITNPNNASQLCSPFDYAAYEGAQYEKIIDSLEYIHSKKYNTKRRIDICEKPIKVFLKITNNKVLDRKPFFVLKNRRISEISNVKAFNSLSKSMIWSHPNVTGYIDISDLLQPTISRMDFKNTKESKALFQTLLKIEPEIKKFVEENIGILVNSRFEKLGKILSDALRNLALKDAIERQKGLSEGRGNLSNNKANGSSQNKKFNVFNIEAETHAERNERNEEPQNDNSRVGKKKPKISENTIELPVNVNEAKKASNKKDESAGLNIKIDFENEPMKDINNKPIRSLLTDSELIIYKRHPEFEKRLDITMHGIPRISTSLITYLCCEILVHYKLIENSFNIKNDSNRDILNEFVEQLHLLEANLKHIENIRISDFV